MTEENPNKTLPITLEGQVVAVDYFQDTKKLTFILGTEAKKFYRVSAVRDSGADNFLKRNLQRGDYIKICAQLFPVSKEKIMSECLLSDRGDILEYRCPFKVINDETRHIILRGTVAKISNGADGVDFQLTDYTQKTFPVRVPQYSTALDFFKRNVSEGTDIKIRVTVETAYPEAGCWLGIFAQTDILEINQ